MTLTAYQRNRIGLLRPLMQFISKSPKREAAKHAAARRAGLSKSRIEALYLAWLRDGDDALINSSRLPKEKKPASDSLDITPEEQYVLRRLTNQCGSIQYAVEALADLPGTRPELRDLINRHRARRNYPKALRRAARVTPEECDLARGPKRFNLNVSTQLRDNYWIDSAGDEHPFTGGDLFECDDMSLNQPYWYEWPYGGDELSKMFGCRLGRQMLACIDTATARWVGFDLIGRVRDAYRAEDIVRFLGSICQLNGIPRHGFRLERGIWKSKAVRGVTKINDDKEKEVIASIADVVPLHYVHSPKAKGVIEGSFDMLQTILALSGITIGRKRGEYEKATALMLKCAEGRLHPADAGFPHISEIAARVSEAMEKFNLRSKHGRIIQGVPMENYARDIEANPLAALPADQLHLFLPYREIRPIKERFIHCKVPHYKHTFSFSAEGLARLGRGYRLLVCFDPANPHAGAHVFDAEKDGRLELTSVAGQSYGIIPFVREAPQLDYSKRKKDTGKREYSGAVRTEFRNLGLQQGTNISRVSDGRGNSTQIARGAQIAAPANLPAGDLAAAEALQARRNHVSREIQQVAEQDYVDRSGARSSLLRRAERIRSLEEA